MTSDSIGDIIRQVVVDRLNELLTNGELDNCNEAIDIAVKDICKQIAESDFFDRIADYGIETIESLMYEKSSYLRICDEEFNAKVSKMYYRAFAASDAFHLVINESVESFKEYAKEHCTAEMIPMCNAQLLIHARAIQMYQEIMCLIKNGFADGAFARWRSLYELSGVSSFIRKYGNEVAEQYVKASNTIDKNHRWARAASCFERKPKSCHISIKEIIRESGINHNEWEKEYNLGNSIVHASPEATVGRLGMPPNSKPVLLIGKSDYNLGKAAYNAAVSLSIITTNLLKIHSINHIDSYVASLTFYKWVDEIKKLYNEVEERSFSQYQEGEETVLQINQNH